MAKKKSTGNTKRARKSASGAPAFDGTTRVCVIHGPEAMLRREYTDELRQTLEAAHGEVQVFRLDGETATLSDVLDELRTFSLMQTYKLVVIEPADQFMKVHREPIERYAQAPVDHATLLLRGEKWNPGNIDKLIVKVGCVVKCDPLPDAAAQKWINQRATEQYGRTLQPQAAAALIAHHGGKLMILDQELAKLSAMAGDGQPITHDMVEQIVGRSGDEKAWEIQEALMQGCLAFRGRPMSQAGAAPAAGQRLPTGPAIERIHEIVEISKQPDVLVGYFMADLMRKLDHAETMRRQGMNDYAIGGQLKLFRERRDTFIAFARLLKPGAPARLLDRIVTLDQRAKTGFGKPMRNLECFCIDLASEIVT